MIPSIKQNINLLGCIGVIMSGSCKNQTMINCSGMSGNVADNGRTFINNTVFLPNKWSDLNYANSSSLVGPLLYTGNLGNKVRVNTSGGDVYGYLDKRMLKGESIYFKITDASNDFIIMTATNTETIDGNALPYTITPTLYDCYEISSDGDNFWII